MTTKLNLFDPYSPELQHLMLAYHLPIGRVWQTGFSRDSVLGRFLIGIGMEFYRFQVLAKKVQTEMDISKADDLLREWEISVGLPNSCFSTDVSDDERKKQIEAIFSKFGGVQTADDFIRVASLFGYDIEVYPGLSVGGFPLQFPIVFFDSTTSASHTIFIVILGSISGDSFFPLPFPIPFSSGGSTFLQCIFQKLAPANVSVIVINEGDL